MRKLAGEIAGIVYGGAGWQARYDTKFQARRAIVPACINAGWTFGDCERVLLEPTSPVAHLWRSDSGHPEKPWTRLSRDYKACWAKWSASPNWRTAGDVRLWLAELFAEVNRAPWPGRAGRTDHAVMLAALRIAGRVGTDEPDLPVRDLAIMAGCTPATVSKSLKRLCKDGWLAPRLDSKPDHWAKRYKLSHNATHNSLGGGGDYVSGNATPFDGSGTFHECWVRLGKAAFDIWRALHAFPRTVSDVAGAAGVHRSTAHRQLPRLEGHRLAAQCDGGWVRGPATPDDVVKAEGWTGDDSVVEKRRRTYAEDRELYPTRRERRGRRDAMRRADELAAKRDGDQQAA